MLQYHMNKADKVAVQTKRGFPKVHFYDQDFVDTYERTWHWIHESWKEGTSKNGLAPRYFNYPKSNRINQYEACLSTFFLVYSNKIFPVLPQLDNFYAKQEDDGAIRGEYSERDGSPVFTKKNPAGVMPPLFSWAEFNLYHKIGLKKRIRDIMPILEKYYRWLETNFKQENGLYAVPVEATLMGNSPRAEAYYPIDFNAQMVLNALYMSALGDIMNDKEKSYRFKRHYFSLKTRINSLMWSDEDSFYFDVDRRDRQVKAKTAASFWTLLAEIPNKDKAQRLIQQLTDPNEFGVEHPFPTLSASSRSYSRNGYGYRGSVFPNLTFMIIKGLEKYGRYDLARECSIRHLYYVLDALHPENGKEGNLWEAYLPQQEGPAEWTKKDGFPRPLYLPYAALSTITLMIENVIGLSISLPRKTVDWIIPTLEIMGIEDLSLKRNLITILSNQSGRGWEIRLESEKLYYFTINILNSKKKTLPIPSGKCSILLDKL
jgi:neutral trehalase